MKLGRCKVIEEIMIGEDKLVHFSGVALGEACTIVLRGASARPIWACHDNVTFALGIRASCTLTWCWIVLF